MVFLLANGLCVAGCRQVVVGILQGLGKISDPWPNRGSSMSTANLCLEDEQAKAFQKVEADAKFMVSAQGITTGTKASNIVKPKFLKMW